MYRISRQRDRSSALIVRPHHRATYSTILTLFIVYTFFCIERHCVSLTFTIEHRNNSYLIKRREAYA